MQVARILLFIYMFYHVYLHHVQVTSPKCIHAGWNFLVHIQENRAEQIFFSNDLQVMEMHMFGYLLVHAVPFVLAIMNFMWFGKIIKGLIKTLSKKK